MNKMKILVADDEPNIRSLVHRMLATYCIVLEASDGEEAINTARRWKPDLILMDVMMPKMSSYTACQVIKTDKATLEIPVVMLTSLAHELDKKLAKTMGAGAYITKPFTPKDLLNTIRKHLPNSGIKKVTHA